MSKRYYSFFTKMFIIMDLKTRQTARVIWYDLLHFNLSHIFVSFQVCLYVYNIYSEYSSNENVFSS